MVRLRPSELRRSGRCARGGGTVGTQRQAGCSGDKSPPQSHLLSQQCAVSPRPLTSHTVSQAPRSCLAIRSSRPPILPYCIDSPATTLFLEDIRPHFTAARTKSPQAYGSLDNERCRPWFLEQSRFPSHLLRRPRTASNLCWRAGYLCSWS